MTPFYFGTGQRRLLGVFEAAQVGGRGDRAVVICHPWGQEQIRAFRSMRRLASLLTATGWNTLRFDYFGTGDSAGDMVDADLEGWERDIEWAIQEAKDTSGARRVALVGLRLGASLAASVAAKNAKDVEAVVLWDPIVLGPQYIEELRETEARISHRHPAERALDSGGGNEILGFPLTEKLKSGIAEINLGSIADSLPARCLTMLTQSSPSDDVLLRAADCADAEPLVIERIDCAPAWLEDRDTGAGAIPVEVLDRITQWLA